ncbi:MAG: hypothetical protein ACE5HV_13930 [Acidobacteriota bacterium]
MKRLEHIEHCKGQGQLFRERTLRFVVLYDIDVYQELTESLPDMAPVSGLREIRGFLTGLSEAELWSLQHQPLTLILSDGRELELELGAKGEVIPHGEFHSPH